MWWEVGEQDRRRGSTPGEGTNVTRWRDLKPARWLEVEVEGPGRMRPKKQQGPQLLGLVGFKSWPFCK